jgi:hypothetical protein
MRIETIMVWLASAAAALAQGTVVVPNGLGNVEGNSSTVDPFTSSSFRYQQVFSASQFPFGGFINSIWFRLDGATTNDPLLFFGGGSVTLSTIPAGSDGLSPVFADNVGANAVTIFNNGFSFGGTSQPGAMPQAFHQTFTATTPFFYNPAQGNLLLDIRGVSGQAFIPGALDAQSAVGDSISRVFAFNNLAASGTADTLGLVTRFDMTVVPEPSVWALVAIGCLFAAALRRRK